MAVDPELITVCQEFSEHAKTCPMCGDENSARTCPIGLQLLKKLAEVAAKPEAA